MKTSDKIKFILKSPLSWCRSIYYSKPHVMSDNDTLDSVLNDRCSICRYGDGELNLMLGSGIRFQKADKELAYRLKSIAESPSNCNTLICIPNVFDSLDRFIPRARKWWRNCMLYTRGYWYKFFRQPIYGDSLLSRFYVDSMDKNRSAYVEKLKSIWCGRRILIVEGKRSRLGMGNDFFSCAESVNRVLCPTVDAFGLYSKILDNVNTQIDTGKFDLAICALGPTATVLCYDISNKIQALDLGHVDIEYEWFLNKATEKQMVRNKSMSEVGGDSGDEIDEIYKSQIICEI